MANSGSSNNHNNGNSSQQQQQQHYQPPESKKEEYRKYLEKTGVIDSLTKVLVGLYEEPERPGNAVDYVKQYIGTNAVAGNQAAAAGEVEALRKENDELKAKVKELEKTISRMKTKDQQHSSDNKGSGSK